MSYEQFFYAYTPEDVVRIAGEICAEVVYNNVEKTPSPEDLLFLHEFRQLNGFDAKNMFKIGPDSCTYIIKHGNVHVILKGLVSGQRRFVITSVEQV